MLRLPAPLFPVLLPAILLALLCALAIAMGSAPARAQSLPPTAQMLENRVLGNPDAPVTIAEFSSLTCPHCASFHADLLPELKRKYIDTGKAKLVYHDFPLDPAAAAAAMIARCAPRERYFPFLEVLFAQQSGWAGSDDVLGTLAQLGRFAGMGDAEIEACFADQALFDGIRALRDDYANRYDITATPTILVDGEKLDGPRSLEALEALIAQKLP